MSLGDNLPATCFPTEWALGASWDVDLVREVARAIASEAQAAGVQVLLKVALEPGAEKEVSFQLGARDFAVYDPRTGAWVITSPDFDLCVGASSHDIRAQAGVTLAGVPPRTAPLGRLSPLRDWLAHPATRERLQPVVSTQQRRLFGTEADLPPAGAEGGDVTTLSCPTCPSPGW